MDQSRTAEQDALPFSPRMGCLISFLVTLLPVCLILSGVVLAVRGEVILDLGPVRELRVWLIREGAERGLGYSTMSKFSGSLPEGRVCYRTEVHYILWESVEAQRGASFCDCYLLEGKRWALSGTCP